MSKWINFFFGSSPLLESSGDSDLLSTMKCCVERKWRAFELGLQKNNNLIEVLFTHSKRSTRINNQRAEVLLLKSKKRQQFIYVINHKVCSMEEDFQEPISVEKNVLVAWKTSERDLELFRYSGARVLTTMKVLSKVSVNFADDSLIVSFRKRILRGISFEAPIA